MKYVGKNATLQVKAGTDIILIYILFIYIIFYIYFNIDVFDTVKFVVSSLFMQIMMRWRVLEAHLPVDSHQQKLYQESGDIINLHLLLSLLSE